MSRRTAGLLAMAPGVARAEATLTVEGLLALLARGGARRAEFVETRRFGALDQVLESRGWLAFVPGGTLQKVTTWPEAERLEVQGERIVVTTGQGAPVVVDMGRVPELRVLIEAIRGPLGGDVGALRRVFWPMVTGDAQGWALTLVPRDGARVLRSVRIEGSGGAVGRIRVAMANGDEQVLVIVGG